MNNSTISRQLLLTSYRQQLRDDTNSMGYGDVVKVFSAETQNTNRKSSFALLLAAATTLFASVGLMQRF